LTGSAIKEVLEDVADNLFNPDPYLQQGGDMVRVGGLQYAIDPTRAIGSRISDLRLHGKPLAADRKYKVAGWASVADCPQGPAGLGRVMQYLRDQKVITPRSVNAPVIKGWPEIRTRLTTARTIDNRVLVYPLLGSISTTSPRYVGVAAAGGQTGMFGLACDGEACEWFKAPGLETAMAKCHR